MKDGPLKGRPLIVTGVPRYLFPEYQHCNNIGCGAHHLITHEYGWDGRWIRSYSALNLRTEA